jgi:hypothetical protein
MNHHQMSALYSLISEYLTILRQLIDIHRVFPSDNFYSYG